MIIDVELEVYLYSLFSIIIISIGAFITVVYSLNQDNYYRKSLVKFKIYFLVNNFTDFGG